MNHVVLLGDSIFDNTAYVDGGPAVITQVQERLPPGWQATLLAVDGSITSDVFPLIDLRLVCNEAADYANPIELSVAGGAKIARAITRLVTQHDFTQHRTTVFVE
jgi:hypothetical protein